MGRQFNNKGAKMKTYPSAMSALLFQRARLNKPTTEAEAKFNLELAEACKSTKALKAWIAKNPEYQFVNGSIQLTSFVDSTTGSLLAF